MITTSLTSRRSKVYPPDDLAQVRRLKAGQVIVVQSFMISLGMTIMRMLTMLIRLMIIISMVIIQKTYDFNQNDYDEDADDVDLKLRRKWWDAE